MYRFIFCPSENNVEDAYALAKEWKLPIQHGDSERSKPHDFDRTKISVVTIPTNVGFNREDIKLHIGEPIVIVYADDWNRTEKYSFFVRPYGIKTGRDNWNIPIMNLNSHQTQMSVSFAFLGKYELVAKLDDLEMDSVTIEIVSLTEEE